MKKIYLEITNACNLDCPFCTIAKGNSFMSMKDFDDYTDQIKEYTDYIYLHVLGEPLLHPQFDEFLNILDEKELKLQLVSNGVLLDKHPDLLSHKCLRKLSVSIHSVNSVDVPESYFETIDRLIEEEHSCSVELRFYDLKNLDEKIRNYHDSLKKRYPFIQTSRPDSFKLKEKTYVYYEELFRWPDMNDEELPEEGLCHGISEQLAILSDGTVTSCCLDPRGINAFGNLKKDPLKKILESDKYLKAYDDLMAHKLSLSLCRHCSYRLRFGHTHS